MGDRARDRNHPYRTLADLRRKLVRRLAHTGSTFSGVGASGKPGRFKLDLRIIDENLWDAINVRQAAAHAARDARFTLTGRKLAGGREGTHLLSGLMRCGRCEKPFLASGGRRWPCKGNRSDSCDNGSITTRELDGGALAATRDRLPTPNFIGRFAVTLQQELEKAARGTNADRNRIEAELADIRARIAKLITRIEEDADAPRALTVRLKEQETAVGQALETAPERHFVRLPANYEAVYRRAVAELNQHLASGDTNAARQAHRPLIDKIVVEQGSARGGKRRAMQLPGDLFRVLDVARCWRL